MTETRKRDSVTPSVRPVCGSVIAVIVMLAALAGGNLSALAQTSEASQTRPQKVIEVGVGVVSDGSFKFGEYNGLHNSGAFNVGRFDLRGGAAFDSNSTWRWRFYGTNPGLETRNFVAEFGRQGKFRLSLAYDEVLANRSDTNQTMYLGAGTNSLTLPANWLKPVVPQVNANNVNFRSFDPIAGTGSVYNSAGVLTAPTAAQLTTLANIRAADVPGLHNVDLDTKRTRFGAGFSFSPNEAVDIPVGFRYEHKGGRKALGAVTSQVSEYAAILPDLIDSDTEQADVAFNYRRKKLFLTASYYGSFFTNNVKSMTWQDAVDPTKSATMASAPSNQSNQFSLTAGYKISANTKLVATGTYGRNTQDDAFLDPTTASNGQLAFGVPVASPQALVVTGTVNVKLTAKPTRKLSATAAYKFDNRDNQTPIHTFLFQDANENKSGVSPFAGLNGMPANLGNNTNVYNNRAYSKQTNQLNLQTEYAVAKRQYLQATYEWQKLDRSCSGSWINCADAPTTNEHTLRGEWRTSRVGSLNARLGYAYSWRRGKYDENAALSLAPLANVIPSGGATLSVLGYLQQTGLSMFGPVAGEPSTALTGNAAIFSDQNNIVPQKYYGSRNNLNEIPGLRRYMVADRNRHKVRSEVEWQATEKFSLQGTGEFNNDDYFNSVYGLKKGTFWQITGDLSYTVSANAVVDLYYTHDHQRFVTAGDAYGSNGTGTFQGKAGNTLVDGSCYTTVAAKNTNAKIDPCLNWSKDNHDRIDTIGFAIRRKNLFGGKLELADDVMFTRARTTTAVFGGSYVNNPLALAGAPVLPAGTPAVFLISASEYPMLRNDEIMVRPSVTYAMNKSTSFRASYMFQRLMPTDWAYFGMQIGTGTNYLPTIEKSPSYGVHVAAVSLIYTFPTTR